MSVHSPPLPGPTADSRNAPGGKTKPHLQKYTHSPRALQRLQWEGGFAVEGF